MLTNNEILSRARGALMSKYWPVIGYTLLIGLISYAISSIPGAGSLINLLLNGAFEFGFCLVFLALVRRQETNCAMLFDGFGQFANTLAAYLLKTIFTFLWMLLLIVPGIIAFYKYSQTFYILATGRQTNPMEAIKDSIELMNGNKMRLFSLDLYFLFWSLIATVPGIIAIMFVPNFVFAPFGVNLQTHHSIMTGGVMLGFGILLIVSIFWLTPYWHLARAAFYDDLVNSGEQVVDFTQPEGFTGGNC